ncbi:hypothetical protein [Alcanivorax sp.]|uniref:hypothetical protein n=1 Tax=Alcanivorax sp. TaxID=1872427 RepID=UPI000C120B81|nr:hypothetical protein [Alcanivorax sp.]PHR68476.1 MAG: integrase [Alcanivorax sp.]
MNPALLEQLQAVAAEAQAAGHGNKSAIYDAAAANMGMSRGTLLRKLKAVTLAPQRKRRCDAGESALTQEEARIISAYILEACRNNGKRLASLKDAVEVLRQNGMIQAGRVDEETGEFRPMTESAIAKAMRNFGLHPDQLGRPSPKQYLRSKHPNHVWQIDPSLCVLYYMPAAKGEYLQVMDEKAFYKNKPANIRRIEKERVWRYVITDHTSGVIYVHYVLGAESGKNLVEAFIGASQKKGASDPFQGVPFMVMVDPGSANTGAVFRNLCRALGIHLQVNEPGKPWAKGQVEKSNDIVERSFEHRIKFMRDLPQCLDDINSAGWAWMRWFNAHQIHTRTNRTRYAVWLTISEQQLQIAPAAKVMRELAVHAPEKRKVSPHLTISYRSHTYSVADIPGVMVGESVEVTRSPWHDDGAQVIYLNDEGREVMQALEPMKRDEYGFFEEGAMLGEEYKAHADTKADTERKAIERLVTESGTDEEAATKRKAKAVPFGGKVDPMKPVTDTPVPDYIPKRGTELDLGDTPRVEAVRLTHVQAAKRLANRMGDRWEPTHFQWLQQRYPDGVQEDQLDDIETALSRPAAQPLRVVNGGDQQ